MNVVKGDYQPYDTRSGDVAVQLMLRRGPGNLDQVKHTAQQLGLDLKHIPQSGEDFR